MGSALDRIDSETMRRVVTLSTPFTASRASRVSTGATHQFSATFSVISLEGIRVDDVKLVGSAFEPSLGGQLPAADANILFRQIQAFYKESERREDDIYRHTTHRNEAI
jgi:hypothetical protein